jgi:hypothetical protein
MTDKDEIRKMYNNNYPYSYIAKIMGISKQRVHQIIKGYGHTGRSGRDKYYKNMGMCDECKKNPATELHHIDGNTKNDVSENLMKICYPCHKKLHPHQSRHITNIETDTEQVKPDIGPIYNRKQLAREIGVSIRQISRLEKNGLPVLKLSQKTKRYIYKDVILWFKTRGEDK